MNRDVKQDYAALKSSKNIFMMLGIMNLFFIINAISNLNFGLMFLINIGVVYFCLKEDIKLDAKLAIMEELIDKEDTR